MAQSTDYIELAKKLLSLAQNGNVQALYQLGVLFNDGKGVPKDYSKAAQCYRKAAEHGHQKAQLYLGLLYQNGRGVEQDYRQAAQWLTKSAEQGEQKAQYFLGVLYYRGLGVEQDNELAEHWLKLSAQQENNDAQKLLDEILSLDMLKLLDNDFVDESTEGKNISHDETQKTSSRSALGLISAAVLGVVLLIAAGGAGYYFFIRDSKPDNNLHGSAPNVADDSYARENNNITDDIPMNIDVFKLAEKGTPQKLRDAVNQGANFNVSRSLFDDPDADTDGWLFEEGETPLHRAAAFNQNPDCIRFLVSLGLDVNAQASTGTISSGTPLSCAVEHENVQAVREILRGGADPDKYTSSGNMFQLMACSGSNNYSAMKDITEALINAGGHINSHEEIVNAENLLLPRSKWKNSNPLDNFTDDLPNYQMHTLPYTWTALSLAVIYDNPGMVNILLDAGADPNITSIEGKTASDYAQELPKNAKLRKWEAFSRLKSVTAVKKPSNYDTIDSTSRKQLDKLIKARKVPDYVRDSGHFYFNSVYKGGFVEINGENVRLRSQPNTQSRVIASSNNAMWIDGQYTYYLGEWTSPKGERWILADYEGYRNGKRAKNQPVWIFGQYTELKTEKDFDEMMSAEFDN